MRDHYGVADVSYDVDRGQRIQEDCAVIGDDFG